MSLRLRHLELRVQTGEGLYGTKVQFENGLVLLRANNSMGKSTCVQAIIYALGLEKMLGPSNAIPLPHAMTTYIEDGAKEIPIIESEVLLEIENHNGERLTLQRSIRGERDRRLVSTWNGPKLSQPSSSLTQEDYYVRDPGAAQSEAGLYQRLLTFLGWRLPMVRRFNGAECPLYLETICPLFIVEQKHGWSGIQANLPTFFGIREMAKRAVEFVLKLDVARLAEERQQIEQEETELRNRWKNLVTLVAGGLRPVSGRASGLPEQPSAQWPLSVAPMAEVFTEEKWTGIADALATTKERLAQLETNPVQTSGASAEAAQNQLNAAREQLSKREIVATELLQELQREEYQLKSTQTRLASLRDDLRHNKDALKLRSFGSNAGWALIEHTCPTCQQKLVDSLLPQVASENPMSIEENITFIENQIKTFEHLRDNSATLISRKKSELEAFRREISNLQAQIRALRQTLLSPNSTPSIEGVRQRVELEAKVRALDRATLEFQEAMEEFSQTSAAWRSLMERKKSLPWDGFTAADKQKLNGLETLLREQLRDYGFRSLDPNTLEISKDTYRPTREGFDLGFDLSASDNIRLIWAYLQGLLELSNETPMNHFGLLVFDEPRQQEAEELSFTNLLKRAARSFERGQQIVFATSEPLTSIEAMTQGLTRQIVHFPERVLTRMS
jgi:hypothetical protein